MAGNPLEDVTATAEEIAVVLSGELQKAFLQITALRIENEKLKEKIKEFTAQTVDHQYRA
jgi:regulator of replication initiation timing